ncbi:unnamed protein product, partial [Sphacelaria rigidula]
RRRKAHRRRCRNREGPVATRCRDCIRPSPRIHGQWIRPCKYERGIPGLPPSSRREEFDEKFDRKEKN